MIKEKETDIKNVILDYLKLKGYFFWFTNTQGNYSAKSGGYYKNPRLLSGVSDILGIIDGRLIAIEVKTSKGKLSDWQVEFINKINAKGGYAFVARNIEDVVSNFKNIKD